MRPIVPLIDVSATASLGVTPGGVQFGSVVPQGCLAVFGGMADICPLGVAVILDLLPGWLVTTSCWVVCVIWAIDRVADIV